MQLSIFLFPYRQISAIKNASVNRQPNYITTLGKIKSSIFFKFFEFFYTFFIFDKITGYDARYLDCTLLYYIICRARTK